MQKLPFILALAVLLSCNKGDPETSNANAQGNGNGLVVNEVMATHSEQENELGEASDWLELYNPGNEFTLVSGQWFVTDDPVGDPTNTSSPRSPSVQRVIWSSGVMDLIRKVRIYTLTSSYRPMMDRWRLYIPGPSTTQ